MSFAATEPPFCRLTLLAPGVRVRVALPADLPVAELLPLVLELVGGPTGGGPPRPWRLLRVGGQPLPPGATLPELDVRDGDLLRLAPDGPVPPGPMFDDPADALAATGRSGAPIGHRLRAGAVPVLAAAAALLLATWPAPTPDDPVWAGTPALIAALTAVAALAGAARLARVPSPPPGPRPGPGSNGDPAAEPPTGRPPGRWEPDTTSTTTEPQPPDTTPGPTAPHPPPVHNRLATASALAAVPLAAAAGWAALPGPTGPGRLLLAAAAAGIAAATAQLVLRALVPALIGVVVAAVPVGAAALAVARFAVPPTAAAIAAGAAALVAGPLWPRAALWLSGMPRPVVPADADDLRAADHDPDLLSPDELTERAALARGYLAGLVGGGAPVAAAAAPAAAIGPGWTGPALSAVTVTLLGLRARSFVDPAPARVLAVGALAAGIGLAAVLARSGPSWAPPIAVLGLLTAAVLIAAADRPGRAGSPVRRRAVDLGEGLLTAAVLPLAFAAMDLYALVRAL